MACQDRFSWFAAQQHRHRPVRKSSPASHLVSPLFRRLQFEPLEDRRMLALVTVTNDLDVVNGDTSSIANLIASDGGDGIALREAIVAANMDATADMIDFAVGLDGSTILLDQVLGELAITKSLTIYASSLTSGLTIDAGDGTDNTFGTGDGYRIFNIDDGNIGNLIDVEISGLTLTGGDVPFTDLSGDGGAIRNRENLTVTGSTISGNSASFDGGGINNFFGTVNITSSTISGNSAGFSGGGIYNDGTANITSSTISGNSADDFGGGIYNDGTATLDHTIVANNTAITSGPDILSTVIANWSLIEDTTDATINGANNVTGSDPMLGPLANNGGPTLTHALLAGSPAIDAGDPNAMAGVGDVPLYDQRGVPIDRVLEGNGLGVARIDIGAFEAPTSTAPSADFNLDGQISGLDFLAWQLGFGTPAPNATKADGDADDDLDVDGADLTLWESQYGTTLSPLVAAVTTVSEPAAASSLESQTASPTAKPLSAELVDAAMVMDLALRSQLESRLWSPAAFVVDHIDWVSDASRWSQERVWRGSSELANHSYGSQTEKGSDGTLYRYEDAEGVSEELLDELFADGELSLLL